MRLTSYRSHPVAGTAETRLENAHFSRRHSLIAVLQSAVCLSPSAGRLTILGAIGTALALGLYAILSTSFSSLAQDGTRTGAGSKAVPGHAAPKPAATKPVPGSAADAAPAASPITAKLKEVGAGACTGQIEGLAAGAMGGVAQFNTVSSWASLSADKRPVGVSIGQNYGSGKPVPYGATSIFAAPNGQGSCDAMAVQIVPSPLPCDQLRQTMSANGRQIGDLAGVPVMQDAGGQTLLVPTAANACVVVGLRNAYAK